MMLRPLLLLLMGLMISSCSARYNVKQWQAVSAQPTASPGAEPLEAGLARVDELRAAGQLAESRELALSLAAMHPENGDALMRASRAESDAVFLHHEHEEDQRALAALSSLDYARRAVVLEPGDAAVQAQLAWALGTTTHLQPMFKRSAHARETAGAITAALALEPDNTKAHATSALLNYRLQTLPRIAKVMARSAPESSLATAASEAHIAMAAEPSIENALIEAKILDALGKRDHAVAVLDEVLTRDDRYPRDRELRQDTQKLRDTLAPVEEAPDETE